MNRILKIAYYEIIHILKDPIVTLIVFLVPTMYAFLFGWVYMAGTLNNIPVAVVDQDRSVLSRELITSFSNTNHFNVLQSMDSYEEFEQLMKKGEIRGGIIIPPDFSEKITAKQGSSVLTIYDASNLVWGYNIRKNALLGITQFRVKYLAQYLAGLGYTKTEIANIADAVSCTTNTWYNPTYTYINFLYMGIIFMVIHQIGLLGVTLTVNREKEANTWIQYISSSISKFHLVLGKCLPYWIMNFCNFALLLFISNYFIGAKIEGTIPVILLLGFLYITTITFLGFFISLCTPNSLQVSRYLILISIPLFLMSGYTWPAYLIPDSINFIARLSPFTWMAEAFRAATLKNVSLSIIRPHIMVLTIMTVISIILAFCFRKDMRVKPITGPYVNGGTKFPSRI